MLACMILHCSTVTAIMDKILMLQSLETATVTVYGAREKAFLCLLQTVAAGMEMDYHFGAGPLINAIDGNNNNTP